MRFNQAFNTLQNLIRTEINQAELGRVLGVSRANINYKKQANVLLSDEDVKKIETYYNVSLTNDTDTQNKINIEEITLDYYPDIHVSCGNGIIPFGETKEKITIPTNFINNFSKSQKYLIVNAVSDSMMPEIKPKDLLILRQTDNESIIDNHIYVFCYDERLYCKYLSFNVGQVIVRSANKDYPIRYIEGKDLENFRLLGEVCGHFRNYLI